jgi:hypothetical protein
MSLLYRIPRLISPSVAGSALDGCLMFARAYVGRKSWGEAPSVALFVSGHNFTRAAHPSQYDGL